MGEKGKKIATLFASLKNQTFGSGERNCARHPEGDQHSGQGGHRLQLVPAAADNVQVGGNVQLRVDEIDDVITKHRIRRHFDGNDVKDRRQRRRRPGKVDAHGVEVQLEEEFVRQQKRPDPGPGPGR